MDYCEAAAIDVESLAELAQLVNHKERSEQIFGVVKHFVDEKTAFYFI